MSVVNAGSSSQLNQGAIHTVDGFEVYRACAAVGAWAQVLTGRNRVTVIFTSLFTSENFEGAVVSSPPIFAVADVACDAVAAAAMSSTRSGRALVDVGVAIISLEPTRGTFTGVRVNIFSANSVVAAWNATTFVVV